MLKSQTLFEQICLRDRTLSGTSCIIIAHLFDKFNQRLWTCVLIFKRRWRLLSVILFLGCQGVSFVPAKSPFRWADSRFAKPRISLRGRRNVTFCGVQKVTQEARAACFPVGRRPTPVFYPAFEKAGKCSRQGTFKRLCRREMPRSGKDLIWFVRSFCLCELNRGLQNLEFSLQRETVLRSFRFYEKNGE